MPFPLSRESARVIFGALRAAGYHSVEFYLARARQGNLELGFEIDEALELFFRGVARGASRGLGAPSRAAAIFMATLARADRECQAASAGAPLYPQRAATVGGWWLLREIDMSYVQLQDAQFSSDGSLRVTLNLPVGKADSAGSNRNLVRRQDDFHSEGPGHMADLAAYQCGDQSGLRVLPCIEV